MAGAGEEDDVVKDGVADIEAISFEKGSSMPDGLYERDALAWSERQVDLLRRLAAGERLSETVDWANIIEEVQDVDLSELRSCRSPLKT